MFAVYATGAMHVWELVERQRWLDIVDRPHVAFVVCLYDSLDEHVVQMLNTYAERIDAETGDAVVFVVLFDEVSVFGQSAASKKRGERFNSANHLELPIMECRNVLDGPKAVDDTYRWRVERLDGYRSDGFELPDFATYRARTEWAVRFAEAVGLDRTAMPCLLVLDYSTTAGPYTILPIDDPESTWVILRRALAAFALKPQARDLVHTLRTMDDARELAVDADKNAADCKAMFDLLQVDGPAFLDIGATPSRRSGALLDVLARPAAVATNDDARDAAARLQHLILDADTCKTQRRFLLAYRAVSAIDLSSDDRYALHAVEQA